MSCVISFFYIKPQHHMGLNERWISCVISFFYIKPQLQRHAGSILRVALYLSSTSNHNARAFAVEGTAVALYLSSTSNHNRSSDARLQRAVALYLSSTSNHNLLRITTLMRTLRYIFLLHQTTTWNISSTLFNSCVISFFYIKPQPIWDNPLRWKPLRDSLMYRKWCWCVTFYGQKY